MTRGQRLLLWFVGFLGVFTVIAVIITALNTSNPRKPTILDQLCPGFTVDFNSPGHSTVVCFKVQLAESLTTDSTVYPLGTKVSRQRYLRFLWAADKGRLITADDIINRNPQ